MARDISGNPLSFDAATQGEGLANAGSWLLHGTWTINTTTEIVTMAGHGFTTGNGPVRLTNSGGALPTGLAINTDYYISVLSSSTFYICSSIANAIAGTAVATSDNGTGTHSLKMLPILNKIDVDSILIESGATGGTFEVTEKASGLSLTGALSLPANDWVQIAIGGRVDGVYMTSLADGSVKVYLRG